jgi:hypothetical protein
MFDTFGDNLAIESGLLSGIESLFGLEDIGNYILNWFNNEFEMNLDSYSDITHEDDEEDDEEEYYD